MSSRYALVSKSGRGRIAWMILAVAAWGGVSLLANRAEAEPTGPTAVDRQVTIAVTSKLKKEHVTHHQLNDEISERWMKQFFKMLDPMKLYFTQADMDEFHRFKDQLDDMAENKDVSFAYKAFTRFLQRVDEKVKVVDQLLEQKPDFTIEEEMITDPDKLDYASSESESRERWRKRIKYELLLAKWEKEEDSQSKGPDGEKKEEKKDDAPKAEKKLTPAEEAEKYQAAVERIKRRYHSLDKRMHQTDNDELLERYLTALTMSYDPHSSYMSRSTLENFNIQMRLQLSGIGAALGAKDGYTTVEQIIPGGPASKDGRLKKGARVLAVGQKESGEMEDIMDIKLDDVVKKIRGDAGTVVRLSVIPAGKTSPETITLTRAKVELKDSAARSEVLEVGKKADGKPYKVGVIVLPSFYMDMEGNRHGDPNYRSTSRDCEVLLRKFREEGVDAVIMDLRSNGGGSLPEAIRLTGLFIDSGPVVQIKNSADSVEADSDTEPGVAWAGPFVVLTSKQSASASEIFAGAIQDYQRGLVVGDHSTHGKGTVQSLLELGPEVFHIPNAPSLGALKITVSKFYRPDGESTQSRGVVADVELPSLSGNVDSGESTLDYALKFDTVKPAPYTRYGQVRSDLVEQIKKASADRIKQSADFAKLEKKISYYKEQKERKRVSLNEKKFLADRENWNADEDEDLQADEFAEADKPVVKRTPYFEEVLAITVDYLRSLQPGAGALGKK